MFKGLANLGSLLKHAQQLSGQMEKLTDELRTRRATGGAGGGMVEVEINGVLEVLHCHIDPQLVARGDRELIEDLVVAALNQAVTKGKQLHADAVKGLTSGISLPGLQETLEKLTGDGPAAGESDTVTK
jgi:nucleoid-associated protein EbfC